MVDPRVTKEAEILVNHSIKVKKGEYIIISGGVEAKELMLELYKLIIQKGAYPSLKVGLPETGYLYYKYASEEQLKKFPEVNFSEIKKAQGYIGIHSDTNTRELANVDPKKLSLRGKITHPISDYICNEHDKIRRCSTIFSTYAQAQEAEMSLTEYQDFVFNATNQDWEKLKKRFNYLRDYLNKCKVIRIIGEDTDITMNVYKKSFIADSGEENLPGGEIFCAPEPKSVNGHIRFTYPAIENGVEVQNIYCEFKDGKCIKSTADKNENFLNTMLDTDEGSRYLGELGIGMNPAINKFTKALLFDEKINGTIHLAFGMAYKECGEPNKSNIHWDIVKDLRKNGQIIADGKVIQKNGKWLI
ncbi:MAG: aminopeptidase [Candidatus Nanoarchaeia archaeon]|nr:aminopeptidase [Candidatus Nanoarchaeia archaeon]